MLTTQPLRLALFPPGLILSAHHRHPRRGRGPSGEEAPSVGWGIVVSLEEVRWMTGAYAVDTAEVASGGSHGGGPDQLHGWLGGDDTLILQ